MLCHVLDEHQYRTAGRGKDAFEVLNTSFSITDPLARTPFLAARRMNPVFHHAEALWYLSGRDDVDMIGYDGPRLRPLAVGGRLAGTGYGPPLFAPSTPDGRSQFERVLRLLQADPDTKRAAMPIMRPDELSDLANPDVSCTLALHFMLRGGRLHATTYMRANDAVVGLLGDVFAFTFLQEYAARRLGVPVGTYAHHVGSMHINVADLERVRRILTEADRSTTPRPSFPTVAMTPLSADDLDTLLFWEEGLRANTSQLGPEEFAALQLAPYWRQVLALFEVYRQISHHRELSVTAAALAALDPGHRWLVAHRWPDRMPTESQTTTAPARPPLPTRATP